MTDGPVAQFAILQFVRPDGAMTMPVNLFPSSTGRPIQVDLWKDGTLHPLFVLLASAGERRVVMAPDGATHWSHDGTRYPFEWWKKVEE